MGLDYWNEIQNAGRCNIRHIETHHSLADILERIPYYRSMGCTVFSSEVQAR